MKHSCVINGTGDGISGNRSRDWNLINRGSVTGTSGHYDGYGLVFRPSLEVGVVHQFLDTQSMLDLQPFAGTPSFRAFGVQQDRTAYLANASLSISLGGNATMALGYGGELANDRSQHEISLGFRVVW